MGTDKSKNSTRRMKQAMKKALKEDSPESGQAFVRTIAPEKALNPLLSFFCSTDKILKWRSVTAIGEVIDAMIKEGGMEKARIVMRRLMWTLNEESGGVGWGAPEAMGEIMAGNSQLAEEYHSILFSYIDDHGNFLDYAPLREGVLWGIDRLAQVFPGLCRKTLGITGTFLDAESSYARGMAVRISGRFRDTGSEEKIRALSADTSELEIYENGYFVTTSVGSLAREALENSGR